MRSWLHWSNKRKVSKDMSVFSTSVFIFFKSDLNFLRLMLKFHMDVYSCLIFIRDEAPVLILHCLHSLVGFPIQSQGCTFSWENLAPLYGKWLLTTSFSAVSFGVPLSVFQLALRPNLVLPKDRCVQLVVRLSQIRPLSWSHWITAVFWERKTWFVK